LGIRTALGAERGRILAMVLKEVAILAGAGIAIGVPIALLLTRLVRTQLFGLTPNDPLTMGAAMSALFLVAILAGYVPARRASRVDPLVALRYE
jgi:ABC-type antimicrobial peptide transport system permease subunit